MTEARKHADGDAPGRELILNQIERLKSQYYERRSASPPPTSALQTAYEIRMQRLYDQLDATDKEL